MFLGSLLFRSDHRSPRARLLPDLARDHRLPGIVRLFSGLTLLWASVHLVTAATTYGLLVSIPTTTFVPLKSVVSLGITISAIVLTVSWSIRTAQSEDLVFGHAFA